jgi:hypothetical protein
MMGKSKILEVNIDDDDDDDVSCRFQKILNQMMGKPKILEVNDDDDDDDDDDDSGRIQKILDHSKCNPGNRSNRKEFRKA